MITWWIWHAFLYDFRRKSDLQGACFDQLFLLIINFHIFKKTFPFFKYALILQIILVFCKHIWLYRYCRTKEYKAVVIFQTSSKGRQNVFALSWVKNILPIEMFSLLTANWISYCYKSRVQCTNSTFTHAYKLLHILDLSNLHCFKVKVSKTTEAQNESNLDSKLIRCHRKKVLP